MDKRIYRAIGVCASICAISIVGIVAMWFCKPMLFTKEEARRENTQKVLVAWDRVKKEYALQTEVIVQSGMPENSVQEGDATQPYTYELQDGQLTVNKNGVQYWQSPNEWWVNHYAVGDVTGSGVAQLTLSVWKSGNFGSSKPFWVAENDPAIKNHFFVFAFGEDTLKAVWQSSNLEKPNCDYVLADVDDDGQDELVVTEGEYAEGRQCDAAFVAVWKWNEWGFYNEWRSDRGVYAGLERDGKTVIVNAP